MIGEELVERVLSEELDEHDQNLDLGVLRDLARSLRGLRRKHGRGGSTRVNDIYVGVRAGILLGRMEAEQIAVGKGVTDDD